MTSSVERIRQEASQLPYDEKEALVRVLELDLASTASVEANPAEVEAAWDAEIAARVRDVEEGRIELLTAEESHRRTDAVFAELGIQRTPRRA